MNHRQILAAFVTLLASAAGAPALANSCEFDDIAIFATNSILIGTGAAVTGDVVANNASPGPVLDEGVELALDRNATITGDATAFTVDLDKGASVSGTLTCDSGDASCAGLIPPVFAAGDIPAFLAPDVRSEAQDVFVNTGETVTLGAAGLVCSVAMTSCTTDANCPVGESCVAGRITSYGDIVVNQGGTLVFADGGRFDVRSLTGTSTAGQCTGPCRSIEFEAPTELRIEGRFDSERGAYVGPSSESGIAASDIGIYVGGQNGAVGGLLDMPFATNIGRESEVHASFYVPNGTFQLDKDSMMWGAVLAADVDIKKDTIFTGESAFGNKPPTADDKDAFTGGQISIDIGLTGSDPEGQGLTFAVAAQPPVGEGSVSVAGSTATYTNNPATDVETSFTYAATDECGATSAPATVRINPPGDPNDPPDDPVGVVIANDQICESVEVAPGEFVDECDLETVEGTAILILLSGEAPCEEVVPGEADPCDGNGNDVPLTFTLPTSPTTTTTAGGTVTGLNLGTENPRRTATVLYTPPSPFTGIDSFTFDVEGNVDGAPGGAGETDTGTIEISVEVFTPPPPLVAEDQRVSTPVDTAVIISLSGGSGGCDINDPGCRDDLDAPPPSSATREPQRSPSSNGSMLGVVTGATIDATGSSRYATPPRIDAGAASAVPRAAVPGERLYAIDTDQDQLYELDPADGSAAAVGASGGGTDAGLAFDGEDMFTIDLGGGGLATLDLLNGTATSVCTTGVSGWQGLASDPTDEGQLYGITQSDDLYKIDRTTCTTTRVNATAGTVGGLIAALEFDANGTLWGAEFGSPGSTTENAALVTIDKTTGAVTVVSQCATRPCTVSDNFNDGFQGIDFSTDGTLYGHNTNDDSLYIIDTTDGSLTLVGSNSTIFVKGLAFSEQVLPQAGFTILTLPAVGTLSFVDPLTGAPRDIMASELPLLLPNERVTYTPPAGATGDPLATFTFQESNGVSLDEGAIELVVFGLIILDDPCVTVGRPAGCTPGIGAPSQGEDSVATGDGSLSRNGNVEIEFLGDGLGSVATDRLLERAEIEATGRIVTICGETCRMLFEPGSTLKLQARPIEEGNVFVRWGGDCARAGTDPIAEIEAPATVLVRKCSATFSRVSP